MKATRKHGEVCYRATARGYRVEVALGREVIDEYSAGNCAYDSQTYLGLGERGAQDHRTLRGYARNTALEMAEEHGIPKARIWYDAGIEV